MNLPYKSAREIVRALKERHFPGFHALPYNRHEPDKSRFWWLSPTGDNPAFRIAKATVTIDDNLIGEDLGFCGFNVEKGLETDLASKPSEVLKDDWFWHRFLELANLPLTAAVEEAEAACGEQLEIRVAGILNQGESVAHVTLRHDAGRLTREGYIEDKKQLATVAAAENFASFTDALRGLTGTKESTWLWIDLTIGTTFTRESAGPDDLDRAAAMLKPFERWMRSAGRA